MKNMSDNEKIKEIVGVLSESIETHGEEKVTKGLLLLGQLMEKNLEELEYFLKNTKEENIKKIIKLIMQFKINNL